MIGSSEGWWVDKNSVHINTSKLSISKKGYRHPGCLITIRNSLKLGWFLA